MEVIILAGGLGTRLRPVVSDLPKPMAPIAGRPFLEYVFERLRRSDFTSLIVAVGYRAEIIIDHFGNSYAGMRVTYSIEHELLGTGGGIRQALAVAHDPHVFVMNGDTWLEFDAAAMFAAHISLRSPITIAAVSVPNAGRFGSVGLEGGRIVAFNEKGTSGPGFINAGVYLVDREAVYADLPEGKFSWEQDYLAPNLARLQPAAFETRGPFIDIGIPEDYRAAQKLFAG